MTLLCAVFACNLLFIGLLPRIFFRQDGAYNAMWFVTAAPFFLCGIVLALGAADVFRPVAVSGDVHAALMVAGVVLSTASTALIAYTIGTHRVPLALWHQDNDAPRSIVTYGAYKRIRHPFYTSFLLCLTGALLAFPHPATTACLLYGLLILNHTAAREERRLLASEFGEEYRAYVARTRRFFPTLGT
jgi:protein-S-isoprenylcysteine O-methyltransferase Ste14